MGLLLALWLAVSARAEKAPASPEIVKSVDEFVKTPTADLPPDAIEGFLKVDVETLPKKLQDAYRAKRLELYVLKQLADGKKKGMMRMPEKACDVPEETVAANAAVYKAAGLGEIESNEVECVQDRTHCSQRELMCEFTLRVVVEKDKKGNKRFRFFLSPNDPLMAIVAACRNVGGKDSNFFGSMTPSCLH